MPPLDHHPVVETVKQLEEHAETFLRSARLLRHLYPEAFAEVTSDKPTPPVAKPTPAPVVKTATVGNYYRPTVEDTKDEEEYVTLEEHIVKILRSTGRAMAPREVIEVMRRNEVDFKDTSIPAILATAVRRGLVEKVGHGWYRTAPWIGDQSEFTGKEIRDANSPNQ